jgi:hypothetical protein
MSSGLAPHLQAVASDEFRNALDRALQAVQIGEPADDAAPSLVARVSTQRRRGRRPRDGVQVASLVEIDGVLTWQSGLQSRMPTRRRGLRRRGADRVVKLVRFEELEPSKITAFLDRLDDRLTPLLPGQTARGLVRWDGAQLVPGARAPKEGRALLLVHGTFSNSTNIFQAISGTDEGRAFLRQAAKAYKAGIYGFDHPTLATSPIENAVDLARAFQGSQAIVDTIAHSRGGVVVRWWYEALSAGAPEGRRRAVFVGSPLAGTSLAAPPKWRSLMDYLTNLSNVIGDAAGAVSFAAPCLLVATAMLKIFGSAASIAANTPLADAAVALVPGLAGQSRVGGQPGLSRLRLGECLGHENYHAVTSNFEPDPVGWKFWRVFNRPFSRLADVAVDALFDSENDLVVDVDSMTDLRTELRIPASRFHHFGTNSVVHHTNYFAQAKTFERLAAWLL